MKFIRKFPVTDADSLESPQKFEGFFLDYYPRVKGFINGLLQDAEEAEDLSQDIFMSLWQKRGNLKQIDNLDAYLFRIARNAVFRYIERSLLFKNRHKTQRKAKFYLNNWRSVFYMQGGLKQTLA